MIVEPGPAGVLPLAEQRACPSEIRGPSAQGFKIISLPLWRVPRSNPRLALGTTARNRRENTGLTSDCWAGGSQCSLGHQRICKRSMSAGHQGPGTSHAGRSGRPAPWPWPVRHQGLSTSGKEHSGHGSSLGQSSGPPIELFPQSGFPRSGCSTTASARVGSEPGKRGEYRFGRRSGDARHHGSRSAGPGSLAAYRPAVTWKSTLTMDQSMRPSLPIVVFGSAEKVKLPEPSDRLADRERVRHRIRQGHL